MKQNSEVNSSTRLDSPSSRATSWKIIKALAIGAVVSTLTACASTLNSNVDSLPDNRIDAFTTYAWLDRGYSISATQGPGIANPLNTDRIRRAIDAELAGKGYQLVERSNADFVVSAAVGESEEIRVRNFSNALASNYYGGFNRRGFGTRGGFGRGFGNIGSPIAVQEFTEGVLVLNVFESRTKEAVWHGTASKRLSKNFMAPELINEAVSTLLEQFPNQKAPAATSRSTEMVDMDDAIIS